MEMRPGEGFQKSLSSLDSIENVSFNRFAKQSFAFFFILSCTLFFQSPSVFGAPGTSGGLILDTPVGARAIAMGEAYTAQADDVSSLYWNPAGIALLNQSQASFMYNQSFQGLNYQNGAVATPLENGGIGGSISYLSFGQISGFDSSHNPTGDVNAYSGVATVGGGLLLGPLSLGLNMKTVRAQLADVSATGVAGDIGGIWTLQHEVYGGTIRLGAAVRNWGTGLKFIDQNDPFPLQWRLGAAAVQLMNKKLNVSVDVGQERDVKAAGYVGLEYWIIPIIALRAGYAGTDQEGNGLRAGVGLKVKDFSFDYAYSGYGDLGMSHRYEVSWRFGTIRPILTPEERALLRRAKLAMAQERYGEATMLFDSLIKMEPHYHPARKLIKTAMKDLEGQEGAEAMARPSGLQANEKDDGAIDTKELTELLQLSADSERLAAAKDNEVPKAEAETLAPLVPNNTAGAQNP